MATKIPVLSQEPHSLNLAWRVGDAVLMQFLVTNADWVDNYTAQIRKSATDPTVLGTLTVLAEAVDGETPDSDTLFTLSMSAADSRTLGKGKFVWDLQDVDIELTRLTGEVAVSQDVTRV